MLLSAFLALCSSFSGATMIEFAGSGYSRQPISFSVPRNGLCTNSVPWSFYSGLSGQVAGRAIFDAPTGGELLLLLPFTTARPLWRGASDSRDVGGIIMSLTPFAGFSDGEALSGAFPQGSVLGTCWDPVYDKLGTTSTSSGPVDTYVTAPITAGSDLSVVGGRMFGQARLGGALP